MKKRILSLVAAACLLLVMVPAITLISGAAVGDCPKMPLGATNYANPSKMYSIGEEVPFYGNGGLYMPARTTAHVIHNNGMVMYELDNAVTTADPFVISTWFRAEHLDTNAFYSVNFLKDADGNYYEIQYSGGAAVLTKNTNVIATYTLPSTGYALKDKVQTNNNGHFKQLDIYVAPAKTAGTVDVIFYVNGEAMKDANGNATVNLVASEVQLILGNKNLATSVRGIRMYKVDANATAFEPAADPEHEITNATDATPGGDFLVENPTNQYPPQTIEQLRVPRWPNDVDLSGIVDYPRLPKDGINYALGVKFKTQNTDAQYDGNNGYFELISNNWNTAMMDLDITGLKGDDDFVISFWQNRPWTWDQTVKFDLTIGQSETATQKFEFDLYGTTYTDAAGNTKLLAAGSTDITKWGSGVMIAFHCYPDGKGTRTIDVYGDGKLIGHLTEQAILPVEFKVNGARNNAFPFYVLGLRAYKVDTDATAFEADALCKQDQPVKNMDPTILPNQVAGSSNYGKDYTVGGIGGTATENADGSITLSGSAWCNGGELHFALDGIRQNDNYIMKFTLDALSSAWDAYNPRIHLAPTSTGQPYIQFDLTNGTYYVTGGEKTVMGVTASAGKVDVAIYAVYDIMAMTRDYRIFLNGEYVYTIKDQPASEPHLMIASPNTGDAVTVSNVLVYNPDGDPYEAPELPDRPNGANNWVWDESTNLVVNANGPVIDKSAYTITMPQAGSASAQIGVPSHVLDEDFLLQFNFKMAAGWFDNALVVEICDEAIFRIHKSSDTGGVLINGVPVPVANYWNDLMDADGLNVKIYVHEMEEGSEKKAIDLYVGGAYVGSVSNTTMTNTRVTLRSSSEQWNGEYIQIIGPNLYCTKGEPAPLPELPEIEEGKKNYAEKWEVNGSGATYTVGADGSVAFSGNPYQGGGRINFDLEGIKPTDDYVMNFTIQQLNKDWYACNPAIFFTSAINNTYISFDFNETGHQFHDAAGVTTNLKYVFVPGTTAFQVYAQYDAATDTRDYHVFVGGKFAFTCADQPAADPYLIIRSDEAGWGTRVANFSAYKVGADEPEIPTHSVTVENANGGTVTGAPTDKVAYGTTIELTATANDGYTFKYWMVGNRTYVGETLTLTVNRDVTVEPVFVSTAPAADYTVTFRAKDGRVVAALSLNALKDGTAVLPAVPERFGYVSGEWQEYNWSEVNGDLNVYANYVKEETTYTIDVVGGTASSTTVKFEDMVTLTATDANFKAWKINGVIVSTDATYTLYATDDMTVEAVTEAPTASSATVQLGGTAVVGGKFRLTAIGNVYVADGETFVEAGIVYSITADDEDTLTIGAAGVGKKISSIREAGQFMYTLTGAPEKTEIFVRSYVITKNAEGNLVTTYSAVSSYTA